MARTIHQLTALQVQKLSTPGMHPDGAGLYLQITGAAKSWVLRYSLRGKAREMGLGSLRKVSLADARRKAAECHKLLDDHIDPIENRASQRAANALASATKTITFAEAAETYIASHRRGLTNVRHAKQWSTTIETYVIPTLGELSVADIDTALILKVLEPIWTTKMETAKRLRGRLESILDWARVSGHRDGENPARWRGHLDKLLPKQSRIRQVKHLAALPHAELPAFMERLRATGGVAARALEFTILTAARSNEVLGAKPAEIDRSEKLWTVPGERMKGGKDHRVPLGTRARALTEKGSGSYVFPSQSDRPLNHAAMRRVLQDLSPGLTVHGFRAAFKTWASERTRFENATVEAALAHAMGDKVEAAYARGDMIDKRRQLMDAWAAFCSTKPAATTANIVALRG
jgi:integrase